MNKLISSLFIFLFCSVFSLNAGGFQVNLQGIRQTGMAHCGAGLHWDASTLFFNPGGLAFTERSNVSAGVNFIVAGISYLESYPGVYSAQNEKELPTPFAVYGSWKINERVALGLGIYTPFGSTIRYANDWKGQFMLRELSLKAIFFQPTFSYKISDKLAVGVGPMIAIGNVSLRKGIPAQFADGTYGEATLSGKGTGFGFNTGVQFKATENLSLGLSFRSGVTFKAQDGEATFKVPTDLQSYFPATKFSSAIKLPYTATMGAAYELNKWTLALDINYVGWSRYDTLAFDFANNTDKLDDSRSPRLYHNTFIFRFGCQYQLHDKLQVRSGIYFDMTPVNNGYITPETPDANKAGISAGFTFSPNEHFYIDGSFLWVEAAKREAENYEANFGGIWKSRAFIPSIGLGWNFGKIHSSE